MDNNEEKKDLNREPVIELPDVEQLIGSKNINKQQKPPIQNIPQIKIEANPAPADKTIPVGKPEKTPETDAGPVLKKEIPVLTTPAPSKENIEIASAKKEEEKPVKENSGVEEERFSDKPVISDEIFAKIAKAHETSKPKLKFKKENGPDYEGAKSAPAQPQPEKPKPTLLATEEIPEPKPSRQKLEHQQYSPPEEQTGFASSLIIILSVIFISIAAYLSIIQYFNLPVPSFFRSILDAIYNISS
ncbi:MAG: hypothetical protein PHO00_02390 [bacterium]|nr:hypothetical protein [bacterium]